MNVSSPRFRSMVVTIGVSFWFFIITSSLSIFSFEIFIGFIISVFIFTQIFANRLSKSLETFALINTKFFLSVLFIFVISIYGFYVHVLRIDLLRKEYQNKTYWLEIKDIKSENIFKQY